MSEDAKVYGGKVPWKTAGEEQPIDMPCVIKTPENPDGVVLLYHEGDLPADTVWAYPMSLARAVDELTAANASLRADVEHFKKIAGGLAFDRAMNGEQRPIHLTLNLVIDPKAFGAAIEQGLAEVLKPN